jgi:ketosteroid isomerase-like protein
MPDESVREPARNPQDLERLLVTRERAGDIDGMMTLYEPQAVVDCGEGRLLRGRDAIRAYFAGVVASGHKYALGEQRPAVISGDLALTSTRLPDGTVTAGSLPRTPIRGRPPPGRRHLALGHR